MINEFERNLSEIVDSLPATPTEGQEGILHAYLEIMGLQQENRTLRAENFHLKLKINSFEAVLEAKKVSPGTTYEFLKAVIAEEAHLKKPRRLSDQSWAEHRNFIGIYFGTALTFQEIADMYQVSKEHIRITVIKGIQHLHQNCLFSTQSLFPLEDIPHTKFKSNRLPGKHSEAIKAAWARRKQNK